MNTMREIRRRCNQTSVPLPDDDQSVDGTNASLRDYLRQIWVNSPALLSDNIKSTQVE